MQAQILIDAVPLYATGGWQRVGVIPDYALYPDGRLCDVVLFYKKLTTETASTR